jgi:hypothetical protein
MYRGPKRHIGPDIGSMAASVRLLVPLPYEPLVVGIAGAIVVLEVAVPYHRYAKVLRWLTLSLGAYIAVFLANTGRCRRPLTRLHAH